MLIGKTNRKSLFCLVVGSLFTLLSFVCDQMVIQEEDQIRNLSAEYEQAFNNYSASKNILINTQELSNRIFLKKIKYEFQADFLQKTIINIKFSPNIYDSYFQGGTGSKYNKDLETIFLSKYMTMYLKILGESRKAADFLWSLSIRAMDKTKYKNENQKIIMHMLAAEKLLVQNLTKFSEVAVKYKIEDIKTINDFNKMRKNFTDLLNNFNAASTEITGINKIYGSFMNIFLTESQKLITEKSKAQNARNVYILLGVISQILGLLFLILLFKSVINRQKKTR